MKLDILYEDNHLIVCVKPPGVLSQGGELALDNMVDLLKGYLKETYHKPGNVYLGLIHRLDLNVGGVMVFAKTSKAAKRLSEQVRQHTFKKSYLAICKGVFETEEGTFTDRLQKDESNRQAIINNQGSGKVSELIYHVIDQTVILGETYSLLKIDLITGRFHQIRAQMAYHGHPLLGDTKYGSAKENPEFFLGLYAFRIQLTHPVTQESMAFEKAPEHPYFLSFEKFTHIDWRTL